MASLPLLRYLLAKAQISGCHFPQSANPLLVCPFLNPLNAFCLHPKGAQLIGRMLMSLKRGEFKSAVITLLRGRNVKFVRKMGILLESNPEGLTYFRASTASEVRNRLWNEGKGFYIKEDAEALLVLKEAIRRARRPARAKRRGRTTEEPVPEQVEAAD
jgi:hypothetical protein